MSCHLRAFLWTHVFKCLGSSPLRGRRNVSQNSDNAVSHPHRQDLIFLSFFPHGYCLGLDSNESKGSLAESTLPSGGAGGTGCPGDGRKGGGPGRPRAPDGWRGRVRASASAAPRAGPDAQVGLVPERPEWRAPGTWGPPKGCCGAREPGGFARAAEC